MAARAARLSAECDVDRSTVDGGVEACTDGYNASPSMFDNGGTINTEGDLGMNGE